MPHLKNVYLVIVSATAVEEVTHFIGLGADASIAKGPFDEMSKGLLDVLDQTGREISDNPRQGFGRFSRYLSTGYYQGIAFC